MQEGRQVGTGLEQIEVGGAELHLPYTANIPLCPQILKKVGPSRKMPDLAPIEITGKLASELCET